MININVIQFISSIPNTPLRTTLIARYMPAAFAIFTTFRNTGVKGILVGGAASVLLGCPLRETADIDINVDVFPTELQDVAREHLLVRPGRGHFMTKITYKPDSHEAVKCDMSVERADVVRKVYDDYTITFPAYDNVVVAGPSLLLADKIRTFAERRGSPTKKQTDLNDIIHCLQLMMANNMKMDPVLRSLYTSEQWRSVRNKLVRRSLGSGLLKPELIDLIGMAETALHVIEPPKV